MDKKIRIMVLILPLLFLFGCHEHEFADAKCGEKKVCIVCGFESDEVVDHTWNEATCTSPKTCSKCGATEGNALGHSTEYGVCSRCGEKIGSELDKKIIAEANLISSNSLAIGKVISDYFDMYDNVTYSLIVASANGIVENKVYYDKVIELCGTYPELSDIKTKAQNAKNSLPVKPTAETNAEVKRWLYDFADYGDCEAEFLEAVLKLN